MQRCRRARLASASRAVAGPAVLLSCLAACAHGPRPVTVPAHLGIDAGEERRVAADPAALARIARASESSGDHAAAAVFYARAAALAPDRPDYALGQARALVEEGQAGVAIAVLRDALAAAPGDEALAGTLGRLLVASHRAGEAVGVFRTALSRDPNAARLHVGLGVALDAEGSGEAARAEYRRALAIDPGSVAASNDLALSMALDGRLDEAIAALRALRARVAAEGGTTASLATIDGNLALVYGMRGDLGDAAQAGREAAAPSELGDNLKFYSALGPAAAPAPAASSGADDVSGLPDAAPLDRP